MSDLKMKGGPDKPGIELTDFDIDQIWEEWRDREDQRKEMTTKEDLIEGRREWAKKK